MIPLSPAEFQSQGSYGFGDKLFMSRKELMKIFSRTISRASGAGRSASEGAASTSEAGTFRVPLPRRASDKKEFAARAWQHSAPGTFVPQDGKLDLEPRLADHSPKLSVVQDDMSHRNKVNGFPIHRARDRFARNKARQNNGVVPPPPLPFENRSWVTDDAPDRASESQSIPTGIASTPLKERSVHTSPASAVVPPLDDEQDFDAGFTEEQVAEVYVNEPPLDVCVIKTADDARQIARQLMSEELSSRIFACDTEVMDIDVAKESPCCHGRVICFSVYCGPDVHFGRTPPAAGQPFRSMLWVDTYLDGDENKSDDLRAIWEAFRPFFESKSLRKVWHNYSFDRHVMERMGIKMEGFDGDTMHMARLWDSSRTGKGGYSLEALSCELSKIRFLSVHCSCLR